MRLSCVSFQVGGMHFASGCAPNALNGGEGRRWGKTGWMEVVRPPNGTRGGRSSPKTQMCNSEKLNAVIRLQCFLHNSIQIIANSQSISQAAGAVRVLHWSYHSSSSSSFESRGEMVKLFLPFPVYVDRVAFNHWWRRRLQRTS